MALRFEGYESKEEWLKGMEARFNRVVGEIARGRRRSLEQMTELASTLEGFDVLQVIEYTSGPGAGSFVVRVRPHSD